MASLSLSHINKTYPNGFQAVKDFNLEIEDKEFIIFVGPSGCGKSTTLRMIAGLEEISDGTLKIDDKVVNDVEPKDRDIAMVFQNYALYPHMTVYDNMAFGLKLRKVPKDQIDKMVKEAAKILGIKVDRIRVMIYSIVGLISALAGLLYVCRLGSAQTAIGEDWPMNSIAASVIGGVALTGGVGNPAGALIGAAVITIIQNIIVLFGVNSYWQSAVSGIVVVLAISFSSISTIVRENRQKRIKLN